MVVQGVVVITLTLMCPVTAATRMIGTEIEVETREITVLILIRTGELVGDETIDENRLGEEVEVRGIGIQGVVELVASSTYTISPFPPRSLFLSPSLFCPS